MYINLYLFLSRNVLVDLGGKLQMFENKLNCRRCENN
jgi:hypothetical protein